MQDKVTRELIADLLFYASHHQLHETLSNPCFSPVPEYQIRKLYTMDKDTLLKCWMARITPSSRRTTPSGTKSRPEPTDPPPSWDNAVRAYEDG